MNVLFIGEEECEDVKMIAGEMRKNITELSIKQSPISSREHVSISLGISSLIPTIEDSFTSLIEAADQALYQVKEKGRNEYTFRQYS